MRKFKNLFESDTLIAYGEFSFTGCHGLIVTARLVLLGLLALALSIPVTFAGVTGRRPEITCNCNNRTTCPTTDTCLGDACIAKYEYNAETDQAKLLSMDCGRNTNYESGFHCFEHNDIAFSWMYCICDSERCNSAANCNCELDVVAAAQQIQHKKLPKKIESEPDGPSLNTGIAQYDYADSGSLTPRGNDESPEIIEDPLESSETVVTVSLLPEISTINTVYSTTRRPLFENLRITRPAAQAASQSSNNRKITAEDEIWRVLFASANKRTSSTTSSPTSSFPKISEAQMPQSTRPRPKPLRRRKKIFSRGKISNATSTTVVARAHTTATETTKKSELGNLGNHDAGLISGAEETRNKLAAKSSDNFASQRGNSSRSVSLTFILTGIAITSLVLCTLVIMLVCLTSNAAAK